MLSKVLHMSIFLCFPPFLTLTIKTLELSGAARHDSRVYVRLAAIYCGRLHDPSSPPTSSFLEAFFS